MASLSHVARGGSIPVLLFSILLAVPSGALLTSRNHLTPYDTAPAATYESPDMIPLYPSGHVPPPQVDASFRMATEAKVKQLFIDRYLCRVDPIGQGNVFAAGKVPALKPYLLNTTSAPAVVVIPGGGYSWLVWKREGTNIAEWLNKLGINAFVLKYRVPSAPQYDMIDAQRAMSLVRHRAAQYGIDPHRIGAAGFSAGAEMVFNLGAKKTRTYPKIDEVDDVDFRPDFVMHIYGYGVGGVEHGRDPPPFFSVSTMDDPCVPHALGDLACNDINKAGGSCERHVYPNGGHGYGNCDGFFNKWSGDSNCEWPAKAEEWLQQLGMI